MKAPSATITGMSEVGLSMKGESHATRATSHHTSVASFSCSARRRVPRRTSNFTTFA